MRIFKVNAELVRAGVTNWLSYRVAARTAEEAIKKARQNFNLSDERAIEVELLAEEDV